MAPRFQWQLGHAMFVSSSNATCWMIWSLVSTHGGGPLVRTCTSSSMQTLAMLPLEAAMTCALDNPRRCGALPAMMVPPRPPETRTNFSIHRSTCTVGGAAHWQLRSVAADVACDGGGESSTREERGEDACGARTRLSRMTRSASTFPAHSILRNRVPLVSIQHGTSRSHRQYRPHGMSTLSSLTFCVIDSHEVLAQ
ncbi:hypothetical protein H310_14621 [Aphanomyces invadans]|uniref:Uncharacterized protein n=1 Tax=Aphanomyces invadans TaxID=157072 RepID=A0A024T997_9STRA|nr:hypothetical protein H310_14621 [Aphanomyces invadans]ETV90618.1 hypothetical protein H310_14621 [Aphanomyces invadans]|eukprot:XP_008880739.1 hypothetical protein H310_14621 [Aphanomyces invadans]